MDTIEPQAEAIPQTGEAEWFPPAEDDAAAAPGRGPQMGIRWIFYGADGLRAGWSILLFAVVAVALVRSLGWLLQHGLGPTPRTKEQFPAVVILGDGMVFTALALAAWVVSLAEGRNLNRYGLGLPVRRRFRQFAVGCGAGFALLSMLVLALKLSGLLIFTASLLPAGEVFRWGATWALGFLAVGLAEEYLTRGFLQFTLARGVAGIAGVLGAEQRTRVIAGFWTAALFFSFIFGFGHKGNTGESPIGLLSAGLIGLVFAFSLWRTGSLWWAVGFHAAWDWAQSFVYGVADSGQVVQHHWLASHPVGSPLLSGGLTGPEGSVFVLGAVALTAVFIAWALPSEPGSPSDVTYSPNR